MAIGLKKIIKMFEHGNVCVTGLRGDGKDVLMGNVVVRRKLPYVANLNYTDDYIPYNPADFDCGKNDYRNFISGNLNYYEFPYEDGTDIYVSDVGVYFPSQFCNELNRDYKYVPVFAALSRQLRRLEFSSERPTPSAEPGISSENKQTSTYDATNAITSRRDLSKITSFRSSRSMTNMNLPLTA